MIGFDPSLLGVFKPVEVRSEDLDKVGHYTRTVTAMNYTYRLRNRHAVPTRRDLLSTHDKTEGRWGGLWPGLTVDRFGMDGEVLDIGQPRYCLVAALAGALDLSGPSGKAEVYGTKGMIQSCLPGSRFVTSDDSARLVIWMDGARLERTLQAQLEEPPRHRLGFAPGLDYSNSQGRVVWRMMMRLLEELRDPDGLMSDPVARETFTDLFLQTVLSRLPHNYTARLERPTGTAIPRHLRRAEAFMHAFADQAITISDAAAAAGCGTVTLYAAFRRFRDTTPLAALHAIRLGRAREALRGADDGDSTRSIGRRFGFTNPSRFIAAYGRQFGEHPNETRRRGAGTRS